MSLISFLSSILILQERKEKREQRLRFILLFKPVELEIIVYWEWLLKTHSLSKDMQSLEERVVCILALQRQEMPKVDIASYLNISLVELESLANQLKRNFFVFLQNIEM